jgi:hypothetical protein
MRLSQRRREPRPVRAKRFRALVAAASSACRHQLPTPGAKSPCTVHTPVSRHAPTSLVYSTTRDTPRGRRWRRRPNQPLRVRVVIWVVWSAMSSC